MKAAHALAVGYVIVTDNVKEFSRIEALPAKLAALNGSMSLMAMLQPLSTGRWHETGQTARPVGRIKSSRPR